MARTKVSSNNSCVTVTPRTRLARNVCASTTSIPPRYSHETYLCSREAVVPPPPAPRHEEPRIGVVTRRQAALRAMSMERQVQVPLRRTHQQCDLVSDVESDEDSKAPPGTKEELLDASWGKSDVRDENQAMRMLYLSGRKMKKNRSRSKSPLKTGSQSSVKPQSKSQSRAEPESKGKKRQKTTSKGKCHNTDSGDNITTRLRSRSRTSNKSSTTTIKSSSTLRSKSSVASRSSKGSMTSARSGSRTGSKIDSCCSVEGSTRDRLCRSRSRNDSKASVESRSRVDSRSSVNSRSRIDSRSSVNSRSRIDSKSSVESNSIRYRLRSKANLLTQSQSGLTPGCSMVSMSSQTNCHEEKYPSKPSISSGAILGKHSSHSPYSLRNM